MRSGVLGVQHVDVASGREGELRERPQVVLPGNGHLRVHILSSPFFAHVFRFLVVRTCCSSLTRRLIFQKAKRRR